MQLCLGSTYAWSVFVGPLQSHTGLALGTIQLPFGVFYVVFPLTMVFAGSLVERLGPRRCAVIGGIVFGCGWVLAGVGRTYFPFTVLGIGVLGGLGVGTAYVVPIATCVKWFPRQQGLVTGIAVAGFGGGAALVTQVASAIIAAVGGKPYPAFVGLGVAFLVLVACAGLCMKDPPGTVTGGGGTSAAAILGDRRSFLALYLAMFAGLAAGFLVNANMKALWPGGEARVVAVAVSLFALANALGRIVWGALFDRMSGGRMIQANLLLQALSLALHWQLRGTPEGFHAFALLTGFNYGGVLVLYAASVSRIWGAERLAGVYGVLFSANIPAALAPVLGGYAFDAWQSFAAPVGVVCVLLAGSAVVAQGLLAPALRRRS
ncbi:MAG: MFS transporter [Phycisphaerae bacterium]|nr:MFS transporter [Phycisphaerae bacterium]